MGRQQAIYDDVSHRSSSAAVAAQFGCLSIQNINNALYQVDDLGNASLILGGVAGSITNLTGDVVANGPGNVNSTIQAGVVTYAKIQNVSNAVILGNNSGGAGVVQELSAATVRTMLGLAAIATSGSASDLTTGTVAAARLPTSGVVAGSYTSANITVDATGRVTAAASGGGGTITGTLVAGRVTLSAGTSSVTDTANLLYSNTTNLITTTTAGDGAGGTHEFLRFVNTDNVGSGYRTGTIYHYTDVPFQGVVATASIEMGGDFRMRTLNLNTASWGVFAGTTRALFVYTSEGDVIFGSGTSTASRVNNFVHLPRTNGVPTGVPAHHSSTNGIATVVDSANKRFYMWDGAAWNYAAFNNGADVGMTALTGDVTASGSGSVATTLANTAVTPGAYTSANITVDSKGRITAAANGSSGGGNVTGTFGVTEVPYASAANTLTSEPAFFYDAGTNTLTVPSLSTTSVSSAGTLTVSGTTALLLTSATVRVTALTSNGFVKTGSGNGTLSIDTNTYLTTTAASTTYAPIGATYITQTANGSLTAEQALSSLATGIVGVTTTTGVLTSNALTNTRVMYATGANTIGQDANFTFAGTTLAVPTVQGTTFQGDSGGGSATQIRNSSGDTTHLALSTSNIEIKGDLIPLTTGAYDLGSSTRIFTEAWNTTNYAGTVSGFGGGATLTLQNVTSPNTVISLGPSTISVTGSMVPSALLYDVGASSSYWVTSYIAHMYVGTDIVAGSSGGLAVRGAGGNSVINVDDDAIGFFNTAAVVKQTTADLVLNLTPSSGSAGTIADFTSLTVYATDALTIHDDIFYLGYQINVLTNLLQAYGLA